MAGQQRQQISELQFDEFPTPSTFLCWKIRFETQVSSGSDFPSEAMLWIKEVEMVESVDEFKSSRSIARKNFPNFEMLDAKIASALDKIIQNSYFKKKVSLEEQLELTTPFLITLIYSMSLFATIMFRTSIRYGMIFWKVCTN